MSTIYLFEAMIQTHPRTIKSLPHLDKQLQNTMNQDQAQQTGIKNQDL